MQTSLHTSANSPTGLAKTHLSADTQAQPTPYSQYQIIRRNGAVVPFEPNKIAVAMMKAF